LLALVFVEIHRRGTLPVPQRAVPPALAAAHL
jgi:hypothetical protein